MAESVHQSTKVKRTCISPRWLTNSGPVVNESATEQINDALIVRGKFVRCFAICVSSLRVGTCGDEGLDGFIVPVHDGFVEGGAAAPAFNGIYLSSTAEKAADDL